MSLKVFWLVHRSICTHLFPTKSQCDWTCGNLPSYSSLVLVNCHWWNGHPEIRNYHTIFILLEMAKYLDGIFRGKYLDGKSLPWDQPTNHCQTISRQLEHQPSSNHTLEERMICKLASLWTSSYDQTCKICQNWFLGRNAKQFELRCHQAHVLRCREPKSANNKYYS